MREVIQASGSVTASTITPASAAAWMMSLKWVPGFSRSPSSGKKSRRSEEHTSELQSLMRISYAVFCLKKKTKNERETRNIQRNKQEHYERPTSTHIAYISRQQKDIF